MKNFREMLDTILVSQEGAIPDHGEDSFCCVAGRDSAVVSVFDGCGGLGSRMYPGFRDHTGAYIASRLASGALHDWFEDTKGHAWTNKEELKSSISRYLLNGLQRANDYSEGGLKLRGSMVRDFPTTAAIAYVQQVQDKLILYVLWAGDSRVYMLNKAGLMQVTADDVEGNSDAMANLSNDGALTNVLSSDGRFELHCKAFTLTGPMMIFSATDGCFGYMSTPMEFEYSILDALTASGTPDDFRKDLSRRFKAVTGDDFAFAMMSIGYGDYPTLQKSLASRHEKVRENYIKPLRTGDGTVTARDLWEEYRQIYERCL